jgi:transcriptional regulator with XRE-family HTH domain
MEETVGSRIKALAIAKALRDGKETPTFEQIAEAVGVSYESLRKWSAGKTAPNRKRAQQIATYLGCPPEEFMHGVNFGEDDAAAEPARALSAEALWIAGLYDQAKPEDRKYIRAAALAAQSDGDLRDLAVTTDAPDPEPTPAPAPAPAPEPPR